MLQWLQVQNAPGVGIKETPIPKSIHVTLMAKALAGNSKFDEIMTSCFSCKPEFKIRTLLLSKKIKPLIKSMREISTLEAGIYIDNIVKIILSESEIEPIWDGYEYPDSGDYEWLVNMASALKDPCGLIHIMTRTCIIRRRDKCRLDREIVTSMLTVISRIKQRTYDLLVESIRRAVPVGARTRLSQELYNITFIGYPDIIAGWRMIEIKTGQVETKMNEFTLQLLCYSALLTESQRDHDVPEDEKIRELVIMNFMEGKIHTADVSHITPEQYTTFLDTVLESYSTWRYGSKSKQH